MNEIPMPRLSDSMEEGTILRWIAQEGQTIERGQELAEIETDKASMVYEADAGGVLHILAEEGDTLAIGAPIAQLLEAGEQPSRSAALASSESAGAPPSPSNDGDDRENGDRAQPASEQASATNGAGAGAGTMAEDATRKAGAASSTEEPVAADPGGSTTQAPTTERDSNREGKVKASPLARRLAAEAGLDLAAIAGSGPAGRVVKADVERAKGAGAAGALGAGGAEVAAGSPLAVPPAPAATGEREVIELTRTQALIARRMAEAKATIPEFTLWRDVDMEPAVQMRAQLKRLAQRRESPAPSFNDLVVKACALALRVHPRANGTYKDGAFELHRRVNVGVAVATSDALLVPVVKDADVRSVWEIAAETRRLAAAVREGTITPPELSGATFSVSNLGMYGVDSFAAVINPPQAAILAVGALSPRPVVTGGEIVIRNTMSVSLTCDHRILYGADAAELFAEIAELLQSPLALLG